MDIDHLIELIKELPENSTLQYVRGNDTCVFESLDSQEPRIYAKTPAGKSISFAGSYIRNMAALIEEYVPFNISQLMNNSGSNRPIIETVVAHTKEFFRYNKGNAIYVVWIPNSTHPVGILENWTDNSVIKESTINIGATNKVSKLIIDLDENKKYSEAELAEILKNMYDAGEEDYTKTASLLLFSLKYGEHIGNVKALCEKAGVPIPTAVSDGKKLYNLIKDQKYGMAFYSPDMEIKINKEKVAIEENTMTDFIDKFMPIVLSKDANLSKLQPYFEPSTVRLYVILSQEHDDKYCLGDSNNAARNGNNNQDVFWDYKGTRYYLFREIVKTKFEKFANLFNECYKGWFRIEIGPKKCIFYVIDNDSEKTNIRNLSLSSTLKSYIPIIRTKPFLLLAGISGTGKSRIVKEMAFASCPDAVELRKDDVAPGNYLMVEVKPNWHDSTELMGYESSIKQTYVLTPFVKFLYKAMRYPKVPFFVCLDEMNLAPVEQYFAEFLSVLESRKRLESGEIISEPLIPADIFSKYPDLEMDFMLGDTKEKEEKDVQFYNATDEAAHYRSKEYAQLCKYGLRIPQNVIVVGTVNMDETTHQFSRKVIDRAMTIEMNEVNFNDFFETSIELGYVSDPLDGDIFLAKYTSAKQALDAMPDDAEYIKQQLPEMLKALNEALNNTPFKIAYRVQNEVVLYLAALREDQPETEINMLMAAAFDDIMLMKVLPRIEGDEELLEKPLKALHDFAENLPKSSAKIEEMQSRLSTGHFSSFWP